MYMFICFCIYEYFNIYVYVFAKTHGFQVLGQPVGFLSSQSMHEWHPSMCARVTRMVERDKNAACVLLWSLGNESGMGPAHLAMAAWLRSRDPSRPLHYESGGARSAATDVICPMYQRPRWCREVCMFVRHVWYICLSCMYVMYVHVCMYACMSCMYVMYVMYVNMYVCHIHVCVYEGRGRDTRLVSQSAETCHLM